MLEKSIPAIKNLLKTISRWMLPYTCILCSGASDREQDLCQSCFKDLPIITQSCPRCANNAEQGAFICGRCLKNPPPYIASHALFAYEEPLITLILNLKFKGQLASARILGELMTEKILSLWYREKPLPDLIIPIPLHRQRLKERGFNQSLEIARPIAKALKRKLEYSAVRRIQNTAAQMSLAAEQRRTNVKNAFMVDKRFTGQNIAIVDDVMTTGSTAAEFSRMLLQQGAAQVEVWCCARA